MTLAPAVDSHAQSPAAEPLAVELEFKNFDGQDFSGADFNGRKLTMAKFTRAKLTGANFTGTNMDRIELDDADLRHARGFGLADFGFGISAQRADFRHADLSDSRISGTYFDGADFREANLRGAILAGRFHDARFDGADVRGTVMLAAFGIDHLREDLGRRGAIINANSFGRAVRAGRDFTACNLSGFMLAGMELDGALFERANLHSADLSGSSLVRARLAGASFAFTSLARANLSDADATQAYFSGDLSDANFARAKCRNASFSHAVLRNANLSGVDLTNVDFSHADLTGANLEGATLEGVVWTAAIIAELRGVTPKQQSELQSRAARWYHDLSRFLADAVTKLSPILWFVFWPAGAINLTAGWRQYRLYPAWLFFSLLHVFALLPALGYLILVFTNTAPTAQLNGPGSHWSSWVGTWQLLCMLWYGGLCLILPAALISWIHWWRHPSQPSRGRLLATTLVTGVVFLASYILLMFLGPSA